MVNWKEVAAAIEDEPELCAKELVEHLHKKGVIQELRYLLEKAHDRLQYPTTKLT